jgi:hypothetical protein
LGSALQDVYGRINCRRCQRTAYGTLAFKASLDGLGGCANPANFGCQLCGSLKDKPATQPRHSKLSKCPSDKLTCRTHLALRIVKLSIYSFFFSRVITKLFRPRQIADTTKR